jgi:acyl dehydratase/uncharacterized OB-fold protein
VTTHQFPPATLADVVRYGGASGDFNPIHYDPEEAPSDRLFAMGMLTGARAAEWLEGQLDSFPEALEVRFTDKVWIGDVVSVELTGVDDLATAVAKVEDRTVMTVSQLPPRAAIDSGHGFASLGAPYPWVVETGAVADFITATGGDVRKLRAAGGGSQAPALFPATAHRWGPPMAPEKILGYELARMLHGSSLFTYEGGPLLTGERLMVQDFVSPVTTKHGRSGALRFGDIRSEGRDSTGRVRFTMTMTFVELPAPKRKRPEPMPFAPPHIPPYLVLVDEAADCLLGSHDPVTGQTFFPPRTLAVDGSLREIDPVALSPVGTLVAWTTMAGFAFGEVDLPEGVRIQARLEGAQPHDVGRDYRVHVTAEGISPEWWFVRA